MTAYIDLLALLKAMSGHASVVEETWGHLKLSGGAFPDLLVRYDELKNELVPLGFRNLLTLTLNGTVVAAGDLELYEQSVVSSWAVDLNKLPLINKKAADGWHYNLFLKTLDFQEWLSGTNLLLKKHPFNALGSIRILIDDLTEAFGGDKLQFLSPSKLSLPALSARELLLVTSIKLPGSLALREYTHFITMEEIEVNPAVFLVFGPGPVKMKEIFLYKACQVLSLYLVNEYYENDKVVIDGIKRVVLKLDDGSARVTEQFYFEMLSLVSWVYEDRVSVRRKLFNERLSLDRDEKDCLLVALTKNITGASTQAKERYNFVITERKDAYVKELKELLKDIRTQSELYSVKIRTLLSNFLRDLLAAIVLVGFTLFTKFTDNEKLVNQDLLKYVFYGLTAYYLLSILMQSIVDVVDISVSKREILYWKNATKEQLPEKEFKDHIDKSLKGRRISLRIIYPIVALCYLGIALACYKYPVVFRSLLERNGATKARRIPIPVPVLVPSGDLNTSRHSVVLADSVRKRASVKH